MSATTHHQESRSVAASARESGRRPADVPDKTVLAQQVHDYALAQFAYLGSMLQQRHAHVA